MNAKHKSGKKVKISAAVGLLVCTSLIPVGTARAGTVKTWVGTAGDNVLQDTNNWSPLTTTLPSASANDTMQWNGSQAGNLSLTNMPGGTFDSNPGFYINVTAAQTGSVTISESNTFAGRIRLNGTNTFNLANGAGAFSFGSGGPQPLPIALAGAGTGTTHPFTNNSTANTVTFNTEVYFVMGGGGAHTMLLAGPGNFQLDGTFQAQNSGSSLALTVAGPGLVNLVGTPVLNITYAGTFGNVTVNGGTLQLASATALGSGNTLVLNNGGTLDSSVPGLVNANNNPQTWGGNFTYAGTQSLDLGLGPVTNTANRIVTVSASSLTVGGRIAGAGFSLTKAGAGTLVLNPSSPNTYTGGTVVSNGVLRLGNASAIPTGVSAAEAVSVYGPGTLDLNGNSPTVSTLNGTGIIDTISGGTPTLTVGDQNGGGTFTGTIQNTFGSLALSKLGPGTLTLGGASTYSGGTTVGNGTLLVTNTSGSATGSGGVTNSLGATLGGTGIIGGSVNWQAGSFATFTQGSPLTVNGSVTLNGNSLTVNIPGGTPLGQGNYTLMTYNNTGSSGAFQSTPPTFTGAGVAAGSTVSVTTGAGLVQLVVAAPLNLSATWTNNGNGNWSVPANWSSNPAIPNGPGQVATFAVGSAFTSVNLDIPVSDGFVSFNNTNSFAITNAGNTLTFDNTNGGAAIIVVDGSSNAIASPVSLNDNLAVSSFPGTVLDVSGTISSTSPGLTLTVSSGSGTLVLGGANTYGPAAGTVGTTISGAGTSTLVLSNNTAISTGDLSFLRSATFRAGIPLSLANNIIITNGTTASFDNNGNNATLSGTISGGGAFAKNSAGTLVLSGANSYNGDTSMSTGTIQLGNTSGIPGGVGNGNVNMGTNTLLDLNGFSAVLNALNAASNSATIDSVSGGTVTLTVGESGAFGTYMGNIKNSAGSLALVKDGVGTQTLGGTNSFSGGTTINAGTLRVGNGNTNAGGTLGPGAVVDNGTLEFNLLGTNTFTNALSGTGALNLANTNLTLVLTTSNSLSGAINVNAGSLWLKNASALGTGPKNVNVSNGTAGNSQCHLDGSLGNLVTDPTIDFYLSNLNGVLFNESGSNTIQGNIYMPFGGGNPYIVVKSGFLTLAGNAADGGTFNGSRVLTLGGAGNGRFSGVANDNGLANSGIILGGLAKVDAGTWTVSGTNTTVGTATASAGTLVLSGQWTGPVVVNTNATLTGSGSANSNLTVNAGGKFVPGGYGAVGSFTVSNILTMTGATYASLNKSLVQSNTVVVTPVTNATAVSGSSLVVSNLGPALAAGDTFFVFTQPVLNGNLMTIVPPPLPAGNALKNNLAVNGSVLVVTTNPRPSITVTASGGLLTQTWPAQYTGWHLQTQTNTLTNGISTNWVTIPGTDATNSYTATVTLTNGTVFYRMVYP